MPIATSSKCVKCVEMEAEQSCWQKTRPGMTRQALMHSEATEAVEEEDLKTLWPGRGRLEIWCQIRFLWQSRRDYQIDQTVEQKRAESEVIILSRMSCESRAHFCLLSCTGLGPIRACALSKLFSLLPGRPSLPERRLGPRVEPQELPVCLNVNLGLVWSLKSSQSA